MAAFLFWLLIFCFLITKIPFFKKSRLNNSWLLGLFLLKIGAGCLYGYFYSMPAYVQTSDTWRYFHLSVNETNWLLKNPVAFIKDLFTYNYLSSGNLFIAHHSYWNNLKDNLIIKIIAVVNVFSFKNYYADVVFFNFFFFTGCVAFFRLLKEYINGEKNVMVAFVFCIPSFLFWCSGIHKDGFVFTSIAICTFCFNRWLIYHTISLKNFIAFFVCCFLLFAFRNFVLMLLVVSFIAWYICIHFPQKKIFILPAFYVVIIAVFFMAGHFNHSLNFPAYIVNKQNEFKALGGNSQLTLPVLLPTFTGFLQFFPYAIDIAFLRPHITEISNKLYLPAIVENIFIYIAVIYSLTRMVFKKKQDIPAQTKAFMIFCFVFALSNLLLMGYTITLTGAIVRYKAFVLPFLIAPLSALIRIKSINKWKQA